MAVNVLIPLATTSDIRTIVLCNSLLVHCTVLTARQFGLLRVNWMFVYRKVAVIAEVTIELVSELVVCGSFESERIVHHAILFCR